jgi:hypothetical protein
MGGALLFCEILSLQSKMLEEYTVRRVSAQSERNNTNATQIALSNNINQLNFTGIHTYNSNDDYEVIDLRLDDVSKMHYFSCFKVHFYNYLKGKLKIVR